MAEPADVLIVALSARALSTAALRSGRRARALDLFGDIDLRTSALDSRVVCGDLEHGFDASDLLAAADALAPADVTPPHGLVYGAGFEDRPDLLEQLAGGRVLCGNSPQTVARTKDPRTFFALLDALQIDHPEVSIEPPTAADGWLVKRVGASGGAHVVPAASAATLARACYYQRHVPGHAIGVSFLADGARAFPLGCTEQWSNPGATTPFRHGGIVQPAALDSRSAARVYALLDPLVAALGLVGLNSLDLLVERERVLVLEVNPRPGANVDVFDSADDLHLFTHHLQACAGVLPSSRRAPSRARAAAVVYADTATQVPSIRWPDWVADRPAPGTSIAAGAPVCTVLASDATPQRARGLVTARVEAVRSALPSVRVPRTPAPTTRVKKPTGSAA